MDQPDYNIEFGHIYADQEFAEEHEKGAEVLRNTIKELKNNKKTFVVCVLIDEFHPSTFKLNYDKVIQYYKDLGIDVDFIGFESKFCSTSDKLIQEIPREFLKLEHFRTQKKDVLLLEENNEKIGLEDEFQFMERPTCALLSAAWELCRIGVFEPPKSAIKNITNKTFAGKNNLTVLPKIYKPVEDNVVEIIKSTKYKELVNNMEYVFF